MNFIQQLMNAPVNALSKKHGAVAETYHRHRIKPSCRQSEGRYRLFMENEKRTIREIAEHLGFTQKGVRSAFRAMIPRGQVIELSETRVSEFNRIQKLYTWNKDFDQ